MVAFPQWPEPLRDLALERQRRPLSQGAILEGERNDTLFLLASALRGQGKTEAEILAKLEAENQTRCNPPLPITEVTEIASSAARYVPEMPVLSGPPKGGPGRTTSGYVYQSITAAQLVEDAGSVEWHIDGVLPKGGAMLVTGEAGIGKSWLLLSIALSLDTGREWLGRLDTIRSSVLLIDEENSRELLSLRLQKLGGAESALRFLVGNGVLIDDPLQFEAIDHMLSVEQPDVIVFDSLVRFHSGNENDAQDMGKVSRLLNELRRRHGCAVIVIHHRRKPSHTGSNDARHAFRGSSEINAFPDVHLDLTMRQGDLHLSMPKNRFQQPMPPCVVELVDLDEDRTEMRYVGPVTPGGTKSVEECKEWIMHYLGDGDWRFRRETVAAGKDAGLSRDIVDRMLKELYPDTLDRDEHGSSHRYRLKGDEPIDKA